MSKMDVALRCYKCMDGLEWDGSLGGEGWYIAPNTVLIIWLVQVMW